jgi:hypothetical protein
MVLAAHLRQDTSNQANLDTCHPFSEIKPPAKIRYKNRPFGCKQTDSIVITTEDINLTDKQKINGHANSYACEYKRENNRTNRHATSSPRPGAKFMNQLKVPNHSSEVNDYP